jgi:hypothetical protein
MQVGVHVSHKVLGLDKDGYGQLLSETIFTSKRVKERTSIYGRRLSNFLNFTVSGQP